METKILGINELKIAGKAINEGKLVVFPTETVYGLGANALDPKAVKKIFVAKGRPADNPLIVHVYDKSQISKLVKDISKDGQILIDKFMPGPISLIFKKSDLIPIETTSGLKTVAIRIPSNEIALEFLKECKVPVAAPSANLSGSPSPTQFNHVLKDMNERVEYIIKGDNCEVGLESSVIDTTKKPMLLLRPGGLKIEELKKYVDIEFHPSLKGESVDKPESPGMKYKHYSPKAKVILFTSNNSDEEIKTYLLKSKDKVAVLTQNDKEFNSDIVISLGNSKEEIAKNLFDSLRECDNQEVDVILVQSVSDSGLGLAIMNRLRKAASEIRE
jgi:L-threonylcarbamoyladenylate synthase